MKKLADKICQQLFNNYDLFLHTFYVLQRHMVLRVKGGAAFSLHAQRASATTLAPGSLQLLSNLHLLHVYDLDISVDEPSQNTLSRFGAVQNATAEMSEVLSKALYFIKLPRFLRLAVAEPVSVGKFSEIEWRPAANGRKWTGCLSCSYHGLHFATKGSFTLMRISLCCWDLREHRVRRLHLVDVSCQDSNPTAAVACDYVWSLSELCSENIRMLGVETSFQPWLNGDKVEKRLGRLIGGCCLRDIASGQSTEAMAACMQMLEWLATENWCTSWWDESTPTPSASTCLGATCAWIRKMLLRHPARDSHTFFVQKDFLAVVVEQIVFADNLLLLSINA